MTRDEAVSRVQQELSFRSDKATEIQSLLKDAQVELEREPELPWFLKSEISSANTIINEERVLLPLDFLRELDDDEEDGLYVFDSAAAVDEQWAPLEKTTLPTIRAVFQSKTGKPKAYVLDDEYFRLGPKPDKVYTLKMMYYQTDTVLSSNIENKWLKYAHELLIGIAGRKIAGGPLRDTMALQSFKEMEMRARTRLYTENIARREAARSRQMGGPD